MRFSVPFFLAILSAGFAHADAGDDALTLRIDAGRLGALVDQSADALHAIAPQAAPQAPAATPDERAYAHQELVSAVTRYNFVSDQACRAGAVDPSLCEGPYLPAWINDPPGTAYSTERLRAMIDEASRRLVPFWKDLCVKARKKTHDESFCQIE